MHREGMLMTGSSLTLGSFLQMSEDTGLSGEWGGPCVSFALLVLVMQTENILIKCPLLTPLQMVQRCVIGFAVAPLCTRYPQCCSSCHKPCSVLLTSLCCLPRTCTSSPAKSSAHTAAYLTEQKRRVK